MEIDRIAKFYYYGLSPFEIEAIYSTLKRFFGVVEDQQLQANDASYASMIEIGFPIPFDESFFKVLTLEGWFRIKSLIKEMKRRRGKKGIKIFLRFDGIMERINSQLLFSLLNKNDRDFEMGLEKIEYLVDIIPVQLDKLPANVELIEYSYDEASHKWSPHI
ncbi:MAG: hypothetical protein M3250_06970 [Thermoproteota archaeon]|nr:hypothetical protein [Thermoproteota archaeon]